MYTVVTVTNKTQPVPSKLQSFEMMTISGSAEVLNLNRDGGRASQSKGPDRENSSKPLRCPSSFALRTGG